MADGTPYFRVSLGNLEHSGMRLTDIADTVKNGRSFPRVNGAEGYRDLSSALGDFKDDWDNAVERLEDSTRSWGQKLTSIATIMHDHDNELAASYNASNDDGGGAGNPSRAV